MPERMPEVGQKERQVEYDRMSEYVYSFFFKNIYIYNMYIYIIIYIYMYAPNTYSQMVCRNDVSRWGSIEESI